MEEENCLALSNIKTINELELKVGPLKLHFGAFP